MLILFAYNQLYMPFVLRLFNGHESKCYCFSGLLHNGFSDTFLLNLKLFNQR